MARDKGERLLVSANSPSAFSLLSFSRHLPKFANTAFILGAGAYKNDFALVRVLDSHWFSIWWL